MSISTHQNTEKLKDDFIKTFKSDDSLSFFQALFNSFPTPTAICNASRQIIFANTALTAKYGFDSFEELLGHRPGEALSCIHTLDGKKCGSTESCKVCGAFLSINESLLSNHIITREFRLTRKVNQTLQAIEFNITASPIKIGDTVYLLLFIIDITHEKRRKALERIFFHDVMNKISSLSGFCQLMKLDKNHDRIKDHLTTSGIILKGLTDEILAQRQLAAAENGELTASRVKVDIEELVNIIKTEFSNFKQSENITINYSNVLIKNKTIISDPVILNRVLSNILKNAIEASKSGENVSIFTSSVNDLVTIAIHNSGLIPYDNQLQIFQRSFSTKGDGRGLGTYSIKLLTEQYLMGSVRFRSMPNEGTTFFVELPSSIK